LVTRLAFRHLPSPLEQADVRQARKL